MSTAGLTEDFLDAMDRHWRDAELLRSSERLANADHLYGLSAECGLKALLEQDGNRIEGRTRCQSIDSGESVEVLQMVGLSQPQTSIPRTTLLTTGVLVTAMLTAGKSSGVDNCSGTAQGLNKSGP